MSGVFALIGTHGIPLEYVLVDFDRRNFIIDWVDYIKSALKDGAKLSNIKSRIIAAVGDVHGPEYRKQIESRLSKI